MANESIVTLDEYAQFERELARRKLIDFTLYTKPDYLAGWFHHRLARRLDQFLNDVMAKRSPRLMVFAPPRSGKSELVSKRFPAYALGRYPDLSFIGTSYASDLAASINRDIQRVIDAPEYGDLFPGTSLFGKNIRTVANGSFLRNSDIFEIVGHKGVYKSAGVGAGVTGRGGEILLIDDPVKDAAEAHSQTVRNGVWEWYTSTLYTRAAPGGGILLIMCMVGSTPVLMADGTEKPLSEIRVGDSIATYEDGALATSTVKHWINQGSDNVFAIRTNSGKTVKANERHPFLVRRNGALEWVRLRDLRVSDRMMRVGDHCADQSAQKMVAERQQSAKVSACPTTTNQDGPQASDLRPSIMSSNAQRIFDIATASKSRTTRRFSRSSVASALCAASRLLRTMCAKVLDHICASTMTTSLAKSEGYSATSATSLLGMVNRPKISLPQPTTCDFTEDEIVSIEPAGCEDVFDIEVDRTHNFIASGLVASNTRWHEDDLAGRLLENMRKSGEQWEVIKFPAIAEEDEYDELGTLLRREGEALHPERFTVDMLNKIKMGTSDEPGVGSKVWASLYQQRPSAAEGGIFKREYWQWARCPYGKVSSLSASERKAFFHEIGITHIVQRWDTALGEKKTSDYSACVTLGVAKNRYYVLDVWKKQLEFPEVKRQVQVLYDAWRPTKVVIEGGGSASGKAIVQAMKRDSRVPLYEAITSTDKVLRADTVSPHLESGLVYMFEGESWQAEFIEQCASFPSIKNDDDVDAFIGALESCIGKKPMEFSDDLLRAVGAM